MLDTTTLSFIKIMAMLFLSGVVFVCIAWLVDKALQFIEEFTGKSFYQRTHSWEEDGD